MMQLPTPIPADHSERLDGPALIAVRGADTPNVQFRLGTRVVDWHAHLRGQLICVESGLVHVQTEEGAWLLPPNRAGWMPPQHLHRVRLSGVVSGWTLLIAPAASAALPSRPCVMGISLLMRALVQRALNWSDRDVLDAEQERIIAVLFDEIRLAPQEKLYLPMPSDRRILRIAHAILEQPHDNRTIQQWARWAGLSSSTMTRLFNSQTGNSFAQWRQLARLSRGLEMLANGEAIANISDKLGYSSPSNFIAMFRRYFGDSPLRYFHRVHVNSKI